MTRSTRFAVLQAFIGLNSSTGKPPSPPSELNNARERRFFTQLLLGLVRNDLLLEEELKKRVRKKQKLQRSLRAILKLGMYELLFMASVPPRASIHQAGWLAGKFRIPASKPLVNAVLRQFQRDLDQGYDPLISYPFEVSQSIPGWMYQRWIRFYGEERARSICKASNHFPGLYLYSTSPDLLHKVKEEFASKGLRFECHPLIQGMLLFKDGQRLWQTDGFLQGWIRVVDPACMLFLSWAEPWIRGQVLDICAAPGGKAMPILSLPKVNSLFVNDLSWLRLQRMQENFLRFGSLPSGILQADGQKLPFADQTFDTVLLDVPCSTTGTLHKNPDIKWTASESDLLRHLDLQQQLLEEATRLLCQDGVMIYSTCSLEQEENELQVEKFLESHPQLCMMHPGEGQTGPDFTGLATCPEGFFQSLPSQHWGGFFGAAFRFKNKN